MEEEKTLHESGQPAPDEIAATVMSDLMREHRLDVAFGADLKQRSRDKNDRIEDSNENGACDLVRNQQSGTAPQPKADAKPPVCGPDAFINQWYTGRAQIACAAAVPNYPQG